MKSTPELDNILSKIIDVPGMYTFRTLHDLIRACYQIMESIGIGVTNPNTNPVDWTNAINQAILGERKYTDTAIKGLSSQLLAVENGISKSNHQVADNEKQIMQYITSLQNNIQGIKSDIADMKADSGSHSAHQSSIIDTMMDKILINQNIIKMLVDHIPKSEKVLDRTTLIDIPVGRDLVLPKVPFSSKYIIEYGLKDKILQTSVTNSDIRITQVGNSLALWPLVEGLGVITIYKI